jgi:zinc/manganese transport system substrate-binding protein
MRGVLEADLVLLNGAGLEIGLEKALRDAGAGAKVVQVSAGLKLRTGEPCDHDHDHAAHAHHDHESADPHVWFDPLLVQGWASNITRTLTLARPAGKRVLKRGATPMSASLPNCTPGSSRRWRSFPPPTAKS